MSTGVTSYKLHLASRGSSRATAGGGRNDWAAWSDRSPRFIEAHHIWSDGYLAEITGAAQYLRRALAQPQPQRDKEVV